MNICVYGAASDKIDRKYIEEVEALGREMAKRGHDLRTLCQWNSHCKIFG